MSEKLFEGGTNSILLEILVFTLGGVCYGLVEMIFRGYTHWSMVLTGGACILTFYLLDEWLSTFPLVVAALMGAAIITLYELCVGLIVNVGLKLDVWDYSGVAGNFMGQICPVYTVAWFVLSFIFLGILRVIS